MGRKCKVLLRDLGRDCCLPVWQEHCSISGSRDLPQSPSASARDTSLGTYYANFDAFRCVCVFFFFSPAED